MAEYRTTAAATALSSPADPAPHDDIIYPPSIPFVLIHVACFAAIWTGITTTSVILCIALYVARMFGVTAGYHRYFSHRSYKTSRVTQFLLAFLAQSSAQRGILWWAAKHRHHHKHSDTEIDVHSPRQAGFWYAHVGWIFRPQHGETDFDAVPDLAKYPELVWLDRHPFLPATILGAGCWLFGGWPGLVVGFVWSTVLLYHGTFFINSLAHVHGTQRYVTGDDSRNNWWLAVITLGEGWHNNHHTYQRSTRQGFRWYEFDPTFYVLKTLSWARVVWDLGEPPVDVIRNERPLGRAMLEKVAHQLAMSFPLEQISTRARDAWAQTPTLHDIRERVALGQARAEEILADLQLPHVPSAAEIRQRAEQMFAATPSTDAIVARAREIILQSISSRLLQQPERA